MELESGVSKVEPAGRSVAPAGRVASPWVSLGIGGVVLVLSIMSREWFNICVGAGFFCMFLGVAVAATSARRWSRVVTVVVAAVGCGLALTSVAIAPSVLDRLAGALLLAAVLLGVLRPHAARPPRL